jgi:hypothetical protein
LTGTIGWQWQDNFTVYVKVQAPLWKGATANAEANGYIFRLGGVTPYAAIAVDGGRNPWAFFDDGGGTKNVNGAILTSSSPALLEMCAQYRNFLTAPQVRIDAGAGFGSYSTAGVPITAWGNTTFGVGSDTGAQGYGAPVMTVKMVSGLLTFAQMQQIF